MGHGAQALTDIDVLFADWDTAVIGGATVPGMFDAEYSELSVAGMSVSNARPAFLYKTSAVAQPAKGAAIVVTSEVYGISGVTYYVDHVRLNPPDGGPGTTRLILRR